MIEQSIAQKFWDMVVVGEDDECWEWQGGCTRAGYGRFSSGRRKEQYAHRFSWELSNGREIPKGQYVLHSCDNPPCVNPAHLRIGTPFDNVQDRVNRYRQPRGERVGGSKLTALKVLRIRLLYARDPSASYTTIADQFGIAVSTVMNVVKGSTWTHLPIFDVKVSKVYRVAKPNAKLTPQQVEEIRASFNDGVPQYILASRYKISRPTVHGIVKRINWKDV